MLELKQKVLKKQSGSTPASSADNRKKASKQKVSLSLWADIVMAAPVVTSFQHRQLIVHYSGWNFDILEVSQLEELLSSE